MQRTTGLTTALARSVVASTCETPGSRPTSSATEFGVDMVASRSALSRACRVLPRCGRATTPWLMRGVAHYRHRRPEGGCQQESRGFPGDGVADEVSSVRPRDPRRASGDRRIRAALGDFPCAPTGEAAPRAAAGLV